LLGRASNVRSTIGARWDLASNSPFAFLSRRQQWRISRGNLWDKIPQSSEVLPLGVKIGDVFGDMFATPSPPPSLVLWSSNPDRFTTDLLVSGSEVIGEPVVVHHLAMAS
ncbi:MAG: hypothetical protein ACD_19C00023G0001, partial [uncultured bacterium]